MTLVVGLAGAIVGLIVEFSQVQSPVSESRAIVFVV